VDSGPEFLSSDGDKSGPCPTIQVSLLDRISEVSDRSFGQKEAVECEACCDKGPHFAKCINVALRAELLEIYDRAASILDAFISKRAEYFPWWQVSASAIKQVLLDQAKEGGKFGGGAPRRQPNHENRKKSKYGSRVPLVQPTA
jgi:hypothetical protein